MAMSRYLKDPIHSYASKSNFETKQKVNSDPLFDKFILSVGIKS